jgi:hypothetical protein
MPFGCQRPIALLCFASVAGCLRLGAASCSPAAAGVVGWWPGDGTAADVINPNNGILQAGATATGTGLIGNCFTFDGTNNYVQMPDSTVFHPSNLTIEAWVRFSGLDSLSSGGSPPGDQYIVFKQNSRSGILRDSI